MPKFKTKRDYTPPDILSKRLRRNNTLPNRAMSIETILEKYVRKMPIEVSNREKVYIDQDEYDFEKMSRMSFDEKFEMARDMEAKARQIDLEARQRSETHANEEAERSEDQTGRTQSRASSIDNLDDTMLDDTGSEKRPVSKKKSSTKNPQKEE